VPADQARVALIPGGARGIGRAVALALLVDGWRVAVAYRTSQADAESLVAAAAKLGTEAIALCTDVSNRDAARSLVSAVAARWGRIDALINAFGPYHRISLPDETPEGWHAMFDNNLHPVWYLTEAVAPTMVARHWGRVINFGLVNADHVAAHPNITAYAIAKTGVLVLTRTYARLLAKDGITVNAISPGYLDTGMTNDERARLDAAIPAGYVGVPHDVVGAVRYLLSDGAVYVNGANLQVSGGWGL
jgi:3-oxoacyl-[acyl-carrier protein] reductase